jgi:hypothetical protein
MNIIYVLYLLTIIIVFINYSMINKPCYNKDNFQSLKIINVLYLLTIIIFFYYNYSNSIKKPDSIINSKSLNIYNSYDLVTDIEKDIDNDKIYYWAFSCISEDLNMNTIEINIAKLNIPSVNIQIGFYSRETNFDDDGTVDFNTIKIIDKLYTITKSGYISLTFDNIYLQKPTEESCYYLGLKIINSENPKPFRLGCKTININQSNNPSISLWRKCDKNLLLSDVCKTQISRTTWIPFLQVYNN